MKKIKYFISLCVGLSVSIGSWAAPANRGPVTVAQPDGTLLDIVLHGDEHYNYVTAAADGTLLCQDADGYWVVAGSDYLEDLKVRRRTAMPPLRNLNNDGDVPTTGTLRGLVILAEFPDMPFSANNDHAHFSRLLNEEGYSDNGATGSVRDYYVDQSYGLFTPEFDVVGPVVLPNEMSYYGADNNGATDPNAYRMIVDACRLADATCDVDFSVYDNNHDGTVDLVYVIYSGYAQSNGASTHTVWPHMWFLSRYNAGLTLDGVQVDRYACSAERLGTSGTVITGIGLICHEFSHTLGLPDIYDTSGMLNGIAMGAYDVMDSGCYNNLMRTPAGYSSFEKSSLGWLTPTELTGKQLDVTIRSLATSKDALRISSADNENEYFLLETRCLSDKWDKYLPGEGMLVVYVDYDKEVWDNNKVNSNGNWRVHVVPANGDFSKNTDPASVPFPGTRDVTIWADRTNPSMTFGDGNPLGTPITDIVFDGEKTRFDFGFNMEAPVLTDPTKVTDSGFRSNWTAVADAKYYTVKITASSTGETQVYEKVVRTYYTFSGLDPDETYRYSVKAIGEALESSYSEEQTINLREYSGIVGISPDEIAEVVRIYTLQGVYCGTSSDGLATGVYVVVSGNKVEKKLLFN